MKCSIRKSILFVGCMVWISCLLSGCGRNTIRVTSTNTAMGTVVQETIYTTETEVGNKVVADLQQELQRLENQCLSI